MTKIKKEVQITKFTNEKRDTNTCQRVIRKCYKQLYAKKFDKQMKRINSLKDALLKSLQDETGRLNSLKLVREMNSKL